jgi:hypothetical protein
MTELRDIRLNAAMKSPEANNAYGDRALYNAGRKDAFEEAKLQKPHLRNPSGEFAKGYAGGVFDFTERIQALIDAGKS